MLFFMYANVIFPLKLPMLTYRIPEGMPIDIEGFIVRAPLGKRSAYGIVAEVSDRAPEGVEPGLKDIDECLLKYASDSYLSLMRWLSKYYLVPEGIALKTSFFDDFLKSAVQTGKRKRRGPAPDAEPACVDMPDADIRLKGLISEASRRISSSRYSATLITLTRSSEDPRLIKDIFALLPDLRNVIITVPEFDRMNMMLDCLRTMFGSRVCSLNSRLTPAKRADAVKKIVSGEADIVVGARSAVLAPMQNVSLMVVTQEHSSSYKAQEGLRYNARDVAVMRGYMNSAPVLLTSVSPSLESVHNCMLGKYRFAGSASKDISDFAFPGRATRPAMKITKLSSRNRGKSCFSQDVAKKAKDVMKANEAMLFLINRKGYSLIRCDDCGATLDCKRCGVPFVLHKSDNSARCGLCGAREKISESCHACRGFNLSPSGVGLERVKEEIDALCSTKAALFQKGLDSDAAGFSADDELEQSDVAAFAVGTARAVRKIDEGFLRAAVFVSAESMLSMPDFRTKERAMQEIAQAAELVKHDGVVMVQTYRPDDRFMKALKNYDFRTFYADELAERMALGYPPYSNIILFSISPDSSARDIEKAVADISASFAERGSGISFYGPVRISSGRGSRLQFFIKAKDSVKLHNAAADAIKRLERIKNARFTVDVDPLKI